MIEIFHLRRLSAGQVGRRSTLVSCGFQNSSLPWSPNLPGQPFSAPLTCSPPSSKVPALALVSPWFSGCFSLRHQSAQTASTLPSGSWHHFQECVQLLQTLCGSTDGTANSPPLPPKPTGSPTFMESLLIQSPGPAV